MTLGDPDKDAVWAAVRGILDGFLAGDRERTDSFIHPDATLWDSSEIPLVRGLSELNQLRDRRPTDGSGPKVAGVRNVNPVIDIYGDIAVVRYELFVDFMDGSPSEHIRNTAVWRKFPNGWLAIHNHEDVVSH